METRIPERRRRGQALVEMAFVFPFILLFLALAFQLVLAIHLHMKLHRSAVRVAHRLAYGQPPAQAVAPELALYARTLRWGTPVPGRFGGRLVPLEGWKPYPGPLSATSRNCLAVADLSYALWGDWYAKVGIKTFQLNAHVEVPCEPSDVGEPS